MKNINDDIEIAVWSTLKGGLKYCIEENIGREIIHVFYRCHRFEFIPAVRRIKNITSRIR